MPDLSLTKPEDPRVYRPPPIPDRRKYLPPVEVTIQGQVGQVVAAGRASDIASSASPSSLGSVYDGDDVQHMGATAHEVRTYGADGLNSAVGLGDLRGWALDVVQLRADVDGHLLGGWLISGSDLGEAVRKLQLTGTREQKLAKFLAGRFGAGFRTSAPPVITYVLTSAWPAATIPRTAFLGSAQKPTSAQAASFANAITEKLGQ
ncbi:hypothetical protein ACFOYW_10165 [Gryllotalpicola reticulitermitis]|uniref:Uncharacterized protein n=1 Tax=Gryllotalpicola reticulitermitis TaxID=1184153 RepID=A0ABV8Q7I8_9MICO